MSSITLVIKPTAGGDRLSVEVQLENTVERLKEVIQEKHSVPASEQRLIYKGQVLKDEKTVTSYGESAQILCRMTTLLLTSLHTNVVGWQACRTSMCCTWYASQRPAAHLQAELSDLSPQQYQTLLRW